MPRLTRSKWAIGAIALLALAIRVVYALSQDGYPVIGDALTFHLVGQGIADGHGFVEAFAPYGPTAEHPPAFELLLATFDKLGGNGYEAHRIALGALGTVNVVLVGLLGRTVAGEGVGLLAALLAAIHPLFWTADAALMSETLYGTFLLTTLLVGVWALRAPSARRFAALGALIGLAALTRGEALGLVVLLALPLALLAARPAGRRAALLGAAIGALVLVLAPWTIRNAARFDTPVLISTNSSGLFVGANCPDTYGGPLIGAWRFQCYTPRRAGEDEAEYFVRQRGIGLRYARDHADRIPVVVAARLGRLLDVFRYGQSLFFNAAEGRRASWVGRGIRMDWGVGLLALAGIAMLLRRRERMLVVLLAPVVLVLAVAAVTYGGTRFRYAAEPSLVILAAVALMEAGRRLARARGRPARSRPA